MKPYELLNLILNIIDLWEKWNKYKPLLRRAFTEACALYNQYLLESHTRNNYCVKSNKRIKFPNLPQKRNPTMDIIKEYQKSIHQQMNAQELIARGLVALVPLGPNNFGHEISLETLRNGYNARMKSDWLFIKLKEGQRLKQLSKTFHKLRNKKKSTRSS